MTDQAPFCQAGVNKVIPSRALGPVCPRALRRSTSYLVLQISILSIFQLLSWLHFRPAGLCLLVEYYFGCGLWSLKQSYRRGPWRGPFLNYQWPTTAVKTPGGFTVTGGKPVVWNHKTGM